MNNNAKKFEDTRQKNPKHSKKIMKKCGIFQKLKDISIFKTSLIKSILTELRGKIIYSS